MNKIITQLSDLPTKYCLLCDHKMKSKITQAHCPKYVGNIHYYVGYSVFQIILNERYQIIYNKGYHVPDLISIIEKQTENLLLQGSIFSYPLDFSNVSKLIDHLQTLINFS